MNKNIQMFNRIFPDNRPITKPAANGLTEERGYNATPLSQAVMQNRPQNTGQDAAGQPSSTQGNAGTGATPSQEDAKAQTK